MEGFGRVTPRIKKVSFPKVGKFQVDLEDGREIILPISRFPSLKKVSTSDRRHPIILNGDSITWEKCNEVYHIQDILGFPENYIYKG